MALSCATYLQCHVLSHLRWWFSSCTVHPAAWRALGVILLGIRPWHSQLPGCSVAWVETTHAPSHQATGCAVVLICFSQLNSCIAFLWHYILLHSLALHSSTFMTRMICNRVSSPSRHFICGLLFFRGVFFASAIWVCHLLFLHFTPFSFPFEVDMLDAISHAISGQAALNLIFRGGTSVHVIFTCSSFFGCFFIFLRCVAVLCLFDCVRAHHFAHMFLSLHAALGRFDARPHIAIYEKISFLYSWCFYPGFCN